jgi:hypothetical protein
LPHSDFKEISLLCSQQNTRRDALTDVETGVQREFGYYRVTGLNDGRSASYESIASV